MKNLDFYFPSQLKVKFKLNFWDLGIMVAILGLIVLIAGATKQFSLPFKLGQPVQISLSPWALPGYALQTVLRLLIALCCSVLFTFIFATWAAKSRQAEKFIIPSIDILQSVPVLAFLSLTIVGFIKLFPNSLMGPESAVIFAIFTAQAWNMALSFYQSLKTVPRDYMEAADVFGLSAWQRFWRIEVPFATPALLWNMMLSMSQSWFALVASEAIQVSDQTIAIPGIGSYIGFALKQANGHAIFYAIITMLLVILLYDQLMFRPLVKWAEKFKIEQTSSEKSSSSWVMTAWARTALLQKFGAWFGAQVEKLINLKIFRGRPRTYDTLVGKYYRGIDWFWNVVLTIFVVCATVILWRFVRQQVSVSEMLHVVVLGFYTWLRVLATVIVSSLVWVPIAVWVGLRPKLAGYVQPVAQFLCAFPAYLLFPIVVALIVRFGLNVNIWTTPLMILGAQWYILFNVIAGTAAIPKDLKQATENLGVKGWLWWRKLILPAIFPYYITGAITAAGGAWNTSIVAEVITWGKTSLEAQGLGAYITHFTGDFAHTVLGVGAMCLFVFILNHVMWRPLYRLAVTRFQME
jgi:NitT/TauT family transport system permease protein